MATSIRYAPAVDQTLIPNFEQTGLFNALGASRSEHHWVVEALGKSNDGSLDARLVRPSADGLRPEAELHLTRRADGNETTMSMHVL